MPTTTKLPIAERRAIHRLADFAGHAPATARLPPHATIRALRSALHMSQAQLAKRAGIPQSHLARIESGKVDLQLSTLKKIFGGLFCEVLIVPRMSRSPEAAVMEKAREKARRNVARVAGTMALEKQAPDEETLRSLVRSEESRLLANPSSELWAD